MLKGQRFYADCEIQRLSCRYYPFVCCKHCVVSGLALCVLNVSLFMQPSSHGYLDLCNFQVSILSGMVDNWMGSYFLKHLTRKIKLRSVTRRFDISNITMYQEWKPFRVEVVKIIEVCFLRINGDLEFRSWHATVQYIYSLPFCRFEAWSSFYKCAYVLVTELSKNFGKILRFPEEVVPLKHHKNNGNEIPRANFEFRKTKKIHCNS